MKRKPIAYASRFLSELESKYAIIELELLAVVWSIEHFKNYVYGVAFGIVSDQKALQSVLRPNKGNKTFSSRLTRWVDRLLPFELYIVHTPGRTLGMADYLSRHPSEYEGSVIKAEELFNDWFTVNVVKEITPQLKRLADQSEPIRVQESLKVKQTPKSKVLSVHALMQTNNALESIHAAKRVKPKMAESTNSPNSKISSVYIKANAENDRLIQKVIRLIQNKNAAVIARLPPHGGKNLIHSQSIKMVCYIWTTD